MSDKKDEKYKGPGGFTAAVGRGITEAAVLGTLAAIGGAVVGFFVRKKLPSSVTKETIDFVMHGVSKGHLDKKDAKIILNGAAALGGGVIAGATGVAVGGAHGLYAGVSNASAAREQHAELKTENKFQKMVIDSRSNLSPDKGIA